MALDNGLAEFTPGSGSNPGNIVELSISCRFDL